MSHKPEIDGPILFARKDDDNAFDWFSLSDEERANYVYGDLIINELLVADKVYAESYMEARNEAKTDEARWAIELGLRFHVYDLRKEGKMHSEEDTLDAAYTMAEMIPDDIPGAIKYFVDSLREVSEEFSG
jgi:hypothetical protein